MMGILRVSDWPFFGLGNRCHAMIMIWYETRYYWLKSSQVYYKLIEFCAGTFPRTILNFLFWHPLFWLVFFLVVCYCLLFLFWFSKNVWEKFHQWAVSIRSKPVSTLTIALMIRMSRVFIYRFHLANCHERDELEIMQ